MDFLAELLRILKQIILSAEHLFADFGSAFSASFSSLLQNIAYVSAQVTQLLQSSYATIIQFFESSLQQTGFFLNEATRSLGYATQSLTSLLRALYTSSINGASKSIFHLKNSINFIRQTLYELLEQSAARVTISDHRKTAARITYDLRNRLHRHIRYVIELIGQIITTALALSNTVMQTIQQTAYEYFAEITQHLVIVKNKVSQGISYLSAPLMSAKKSILSALSVKKDTPEISPSKASPDDFKNKTPYTPKPSWKDHATSFWNDIQRTIHSEITGPLQRLALYLYSLIHAIHSWTTETFYYLAQRVNALWDNAARIVKKSKTLPVTQKPSKNEPATIPSPHISLIDRLSQLWNQMLLRITFAMQTNLIQPIKRAAAYLYHLIKSAHDWTTRSFYKIAQRVNALWDNAARIVKKQKSLPTKPEQTEEQALIDKTPVTHPSQKSWSFQLKLLLIALQLKYELALRSGIINPAKQLISYSSTLAQRIRSWVMKQLYQLQHELQEFGNHLAAKLRMTRSLPDHNAEQKQDDEQTAQPHIPHSSWTNDIKTMWHELLFQANFNLHFHIIIPFKRIIAYLAQQVTNLKVQWAFHKMRFTQYVWSLNPFQRSNTTLPEVEESVVVNDKHIQPSTSPAESFKNLLQDIRTTIVSFAQRSIIQPLIYLFYLPHHTARKISRGVILNPARLFSKAVYQFAATVSSRVTTIGRVIKTTITSYAQKTLMSVHRVIEAITHALFRSPVKMIKRLAAWLYALAIQLRHAIAKRLSPLKPTNVSKIIKSFDRPVIASRPLKRDDVHEMVNSGTWLFQLKKLATRIKVSASELVHRYIVLPTKHILYAKHYLALSVTEGFILAPSRKATSATIFISRRMAKLVRSLIALINRILIRPLINTIYRINRLILDGTSFIATLPQRTRSMLTIVSQGYRNVTRSMIRTARATYTVSHQRAMQGINLPRTLISLCFSGIKELGTALMLFFISLGEGLYDLSSQVLVGTNQRVKGAAQQQRALLAKASAKASSAITYTAHTSRHVANKAIRSPIVLGSFISRLELGRRSYAALSWLITITIIKPFKLISYGIFTIANSITAILELINQGLLIVFVQIPQRILSLAVRLINSLMRTLSPIKHGIIFAGQSVARAPGHLRTSLQRRALKLSMLIKKAVQTGITLAIFPVRLASQGLRGAITYIEIMITVPYRIATSFVQIMSKVVRDIISLNMLHSIIDRPGAQIGLTCASLLYIGAILTGLYYDQPYGETLQVPPAYLEHETPYASSVETGLTIERFEAFSFAKNHFKVDAIVWFSFPRGSESLETISNFSIANGTILEKSSPFIRQNADTITASYRVSMNVQTPLNYQYFPFGGHRLAFTIENQDVSPQELYFVTSSKNIELSNDINSNQWIPAQFHAYSGHVGAPEHQAAGQEHRLSNPVAVFTIDFDNHDLRSIATLYLPMLLIFLIGLLSLLRPVGDNNKMIMSASSMPILVLFKSVINGLTPEQTNFSHVDITYLVLVFLALAILIFNAFLMLRQRDLIRTSKERQVKVNLQLKRLNNLFFIGVLGALCFMITAISIIP
jgi:hypothetical protein